MARSAKCHRNLHITYFNDAPFCFPRMRLRAPERSPNAGLRSSVQRLFLVVVSVVQPCSSIRMVNQNLSCLHVAIAFLHQYHPPNNIDGILSTWVSRLPTPTGMDISEN